MTKNVKNLITTMICAGLLSMLVLPSTTVLAIKHNMPKSQSKQASNQPIDEKKDTENKNVPTIAESWEKVIKFKWKQINKTDAWNIGKSIGGSIAALTVAYMLFNHTPQANNSGPIINPENDDDHTPDITIDRGLNNSNNNRPNNDPLPIPEPLFDARTTVRHHVPVVQQRGASCGYHALLNSVISIHEINQNEAQDIINQKFAQANSEWRLGIIQNRKKVVVRHYLKNLFHECMPLRQNQQREWDEKLNGFFGWWYRYFDKAPVRELNNDETNGLDAISRIYTEAFVENNNLNILHENGPAQLRALIERYRPQSTPEDIQNYQNCMQLINFAQLAGKIAPINQIIPRARNFASNLHESDLWGDNLITDEMETLKNLAQQEFGLDANDITIIDNTHLLNTEAYRLYMVNPIREKIQLIKTCNHGFCVRASNNNDNIIEINQLHETITKNNSIIIKTQQEIIDLEETIQLNTSTANEKSQAQKNLTEKQSALRQAQNKKQNAEKRQSVINRKFSDDRASTHWISVTLRRVNGHNSYIIKDSMGHDCTNHPDVLRLIEALERPEQIEDIIFDI